MAILRINNLPAGNMLKASLLSLNNYAVQADDHLPFSVGLAKLSAKCSLKLMLN
ncbi:MAG: hypothetical protein JKY87_01505 [Mariprofundus sp.]|nr:hypothetical protein [Mariprofundus sp.]